jgi:hypothetical protein
MRTQIAGIPCTVEVTRHVVVKPWGGSPHTCPSSDDYYGYSEVEFEVCDRRGRPAPWLERKMTEDDVRRIEGEILSA